MEAEGDSPRQLDPRNRGMVESARVEDHEVATVAVAVVTDRQQAALVLGGIGPDGHHRAFARHFGGPETAGQRGAGSDVSCLRRTAPRWVRRPSWHLNQVGVPTLRRWGQGRTSSPAGAVPDKFGEI